MESHGLNGPAESLPVVLDIGTGTGLLAMLAIKAGAPSVIGEGQLLYSATAPRTSRSILGAAGCWAARLGPRDLHVSELCTTLKPNARPSSLQDVSAS